MPESDNKVETSAALRLGVEALSKTSTTSFFSEQEPKRDREKRHTTAPNRTVICLLILLLFKTTFNASYLPLTVVFSLIHPGTVKEAPSVRFLMNNSVLSG